MDSAIDEEFENLILFLFKRSDDEEITTGKFKFFISNLHDFEYYTLEKPLYGSEQGNFYYCF